MAFRSALRRSIPCLDAVHQSVHAHRRAAAITARPGAARPILVYQMGKVGSTSVMRALERACPARPALHVHFLAKRGAGAGPVPADHRLGRALRRRIDRVGAALRVDIVTLVRDPIARQVSALFQNPEHAQDDLRGADGAIDVERAVETLRARLTRVDACAYAHEWFDRELRTVFDVDVFAHPFDFERGFSIVPGGRVLVLVLRTEDLDATLAPGLSALLGVESTCIAGDRGNDRAQTDDGSAYAAVQGALRLERADCERIYANRFSRHFYSKAMIEAFTRRWTGAACDPEPRDG